MKRILGRPLSIGAVSLLTLFIMAGCQSVPQQNFNTAAAKQIPSPTETAARTKELVALGRASLLDERYDEAATHFEDALKLDDGNNEARLGMGEINLAMRDAKRALAWFQSVPEASAAFPRARQGAGLALLMLGQHEDAERLLERAIVHDMSQSRDVWLVEGINEPPELQLVGDEFWRSLNGLGQVHDRLGEWEMARFYYDAALKLRPNEASLHNNRGISFMLKGDHEAAAQAFLEALRLAPDSTVTAMNLRLALAWQGKYFAAINDVAGGDTPLVLNNIGYIAMARGDLSDAEAYLSQALEASPSYYPVAAKNLRRLKVLQERARLSSAADRSSKS